MSFPNSRTNRPIDPGITEDGSIKLKLHWQILIALVLAVIAGRFTGSDGSLFGLPIIDFYGFLGSLFLQALTMLIVPLILSSIITGVAGMGDSGAMGRLGGKTLLYYLFTSLFAILTGLTLVNAVATHKSHLTLTPGGDDKDNARPQLLSKAPVAQLDRVPGYEPGGREFESLRARQIS